MTKLLSSPIKWYGGKSRLVSKLLDFIPDHDTYLEVFAGAAWLLFGKQTSPLEVINDLDSGVTNFYQVLRHPDMFERFLELVSSTPYSREEHKICQETWWSCDDPVEKARRWFVVARQSYGAIMKGGWGYSKTIGRNGIAPAVKSWLSSIERLPEIHSRLRHVQIDNLDFRAIIDKYDSPSTFLYLDPPYVHATRRSTQDYAHEMSDIDHEELVTRLLSLKGKAILSGYANPIYEPLEREGWERKDFDWKALVIKKNNQRTESIWIKNC